VVDLEEHVMKRFIKIIPFLFCALSLFAKDVIELVESIPVETTLDNPDIRNTREVWIDMIDGAETSLDFGEFYISHKEGEALEPVLDAVYRASDRGVKVRFIVDGNMYKTYPETVDKLGKYKNISVHIYRLNDITGGVLHAKYFIVDGKELFLGSQNFDWRALKHIHELGLRLVHEKIVSFYQEIFNLDWQLSDENVHVEHIIRKLEKSDELVQFDVSSEKYGEMTIIPTASNPSIIYHRPNWDETQMVRLIDSAKESLQLQFLSYSPLSRGEIYEALDFSLRRAAARGVKVEMILSDWNFYSPRIEYIKSLHAIPNVEIKFSTIPEASEGYIGFARVEHCKFIVADSKAFWLGTSNASKSYFHKGRNLGIVIENKKISNRVSEIFSKSRDSEYCYPVDLCKEYERKETSE
jgi:phosphatidylserine/phosphatidylglycerophosphate/cardiolipin synthase-like enzyme